MTGNALSIDFHLANTISLKPNTDDITQEHVRMTGNALSVDFHLANTIKVLKS